MRAPLSVRSQEVKNVRLLARDVNARREQRAFVVEGSTLVMDAIRSPLRVKHVLHTKSVSPEILQECEAADIPQALVSDAALASMATTVTPQPILAVVTQGSWLLSQAIKKAQGMGHIVILDAVQDPGNAGTILRCAEASGAVLVVFGAQSVDAYNPKVVRSSAGSLFRQVVVSASYSTAETIRQLRSAGVRVYGASNRESNYDVADLRNAGLVVGNEANGLSPEVLASVDGFVGIPQVGGVESLNVAMATTVLCFEAARQRRSSLDAGDRAGNLT